MTNSELKTILETVPGIPFAQSHFKKGKEPPKPYGVWYEDGDNSIKADGKTAFVIPNFIIELYTTIKSPETVNKVLTVLSNNDIAYDIVGEQFLDDENMYMTIIDLD